MQINWSRAGRVGLLLLLAMLCCSRQAAGAQPRAARSVWLWYPGAAAVAFCNSVKIAQSQRGSYFEVCGFNRGYFGLQESANGQHVIIFSVWDAVQRGDKPAGRSAQVKVLYHARDIKVSRFGGEGTGAHLLWGYPWRLGRSYHLAIIAQAAGKRTAYAAWFYLNRQKRWKHLATFSTPTTVPRGVLGGYYSFIEDFWRNTLSATLVRRALYGPAWIWRANGRWQPLTTAVLGGSDAPWEQRHHISGWIVGDCWGVQTGGGTVQSIHVGSKLKLGVVAAQPPGFLELLPLRHGGRQG